MYIFQIWAQYIGIYDVYLYRLCYGCYIKKESELYPIPRIRQKTFNIYLQLYT